jgi:hypothetical protein
LQHKFFLVCITARIDDQRVEIVVPKQIAVYLNGIEAKGLNMHAKAENEKTKVAIISEKLLFGLLKKQRKQKYVVK